MSTHTTYVIIDTETGGLDPNHHSLISVGLVDSSGNKMDEFIVREPTLFADPRSMAIHGITEAQIETEGLTPNDAVDRFEAFFEDIDGTILLTGHNISFDLSFIKRLYRIAERQQPRRISHRSIDTHTMLWTAIQMGLLPTETSSSDGAFKHFNIEPPADKRHTALGDAIATQKLVSALLTLFSTSKTA